MSASGGSGQYVVQKHWRATQERIEKFLSDTYFTDVNLKGRLYSAHSPLQNIKWCKSKAGKISFMEAEDSMQREGVDITNSTSGFALGPAWSTHWFQCSITIPIEWAGGEVRFRWDSSCEAMIWMNGEPIQGLTGSSDSHQLRTDYVLTDCAHGGESFIIFVEAAANGMFGSGKDGMINPPDPNRKFSLNLVEMASFDREVYDLIMKLKILYDISKLLPENCPRVFEALYTANEIINTCNPFDKSTFQRCRDIAARFLKDKNGDSQQIIHAIGHCHIDSAWLWPYSETRRKCGRSWASTLLLMDKYPEFTFVCSQAQQLEWVKQDYPSIYLKIKDKVSCGQFIPAGGTWIEMDGNIPSGESFVRQFLIGQRFFKQEFGSYCKEFWLPDTFGYSAQLPQLMSNAGIKYFLTQKLSWNLTNKFPHNSFIWEGIDGSQVLTHFPPADTYESRADISDLIKSVKQNKDKGRSRVSMLLYGHGDGGGGPTDDMLESLAQLKNVDGIPRVEFSSPDRFFSALEADKKNLCKWVGELYLELHRGTYTSQAKIKQRNRKGEFLFHNVDFIAAINSSVSSLNPENVKEQLLLLWKKFLLNQFHDVIPGSCIEQVVIDAMEIYDEVELESREIFKVQCKAVLSKLFPKSLQPSHVVLNSFSWVRKEIVKITEENTDVISKRPILDSSNGFIQQTLKDGSELKYVISPPMSIGMLVETVPASGVSLSQDHGGNYVFENHLLRATVTPSGLLKSLIHKETLKEAILQTSGDDGLGNQFVLFDDVPLFWDAWDVMEYHLETRKPLCNQLSQDKASIVENGPLRASLKVCNDISERSSIIQEIVLHADSPYMEFNTEVSWHENHKFLKVEFPLNVRSHEATYEIQFGHVSRPTHFNTSWDQARFEVCGHKWGDLSEHGFGVSLLNDCKYGYSTLNNIMRLSLLRSPKAPDSNCDMGVHKFRYAIMPHKGSFQDSRVIQEAYNFNHPLTTMSSIHYGPARSFFSVDNPAVIIETVKMYEDAVDGERQAALVVRLYEAYGGHAKAILTCDNMVKYQRCNLLEEFQESFQNGEYINLEMKPFEVVCFLVYTEI